MLEVRATRIFESPADAAYFFGYFGTPQVSADGARLLALRVARFDRVPEPEDMAQVGWFDLTVSDRVFHVIGQTNAFNWQQGAMLQFLGPDFRSRVIWNHFDGTAYRARIHDMDSGRWRDVPAVYNPFPDGRLATTLDFERHAWCRRGYSYGNVMDPEKNRPVVEGDAIWSVDLQTGASVPLITLADMMGLAPKSTMQGATHYLEHMTASPDSTQFAFLHRWRHENGIHSRLLVARRDGSDVRILNDSGRMSHFCWTSPTGILGYGGKANPVNTLRRNRALLRTVFRTLMPLYKRFIRDSSGLAKSLTGDAYYVFDTEEPGRLTLVAPSIRAEDGHPAMLPGGRFFLTDTYARAAHDQRPRMLMVDLKTGMNVVLDELSSIPEYDESPVRCDLHPRVSQQGEIVSIDTMDGGQRRTYAYRLEFG
jgi:hypothetical protein